MPQEWQKILDENGITRTEQEENPDKVLAVVQFYQGQDAPNNEDEEVWQKMRNAHGAQPMSREGSRDGGAQFANPVRPIR